MNALIVVPLASAGLFLAAGVANGQDNGADAQARGRAILEQNANQTAQDATDMPYSETGQLGAPQVRFITHASYGGSADSGGESGGPRCAPGSQCNIFRGR
jgi:hypothetical protein